MIAIKPTQIPLRNAEANFISMRSEFNLNTDTSIVQWFLYDSERKPITNGAVEIPSETHLAWGVDDSIVEDYVLEQLNLERL